MFATIKKKCPSFFVYFVFSFIGLLYLCVQFQIYEMRMPSNLLSNIYIILFNICVVMMTWSMFVTINADPGRVPENW